MLVFTQAALASTISKPYTYAPGQTLPAATLNANYDTIYNDYNGNITNANISNSAGIVLSKLNPTSILFILMGSGLNTLASGVTGDTVPRITQTSDGQLKAGPGAAAALDIALKRASSTGWSLRNAADNAYVDLALQNLVVNGAGTFTTPIAGTSGGTGTGTNTSQDILVGNGSGGWTRLPIGGVGTVLGNVAGSLGYSSAGSGTVTSVGLAIPNFPFTITNSPVVGSATLTATPQAAKGDLIAGNGSNSYGRLSVGSNGLPVVANSGAATGLNYAVLGTGGGGTGLNSYSKGTLLAGDNSSSLGALSVGGNGTVPIADNSQALGIRWGSPGGGLGGNGSDGALNKSGVTETQIQAYNATTFTLNTTTAYQPMSGTVINSTGKFFIDASSAAKLNVKAAMTGPAGLAGLGRTGGGPGAGTGGLTSTQGGGGGGFGGAGGNGGGRNISVNLGGVGGLAYEPKLFAGGSTGGAGSWDSSNSTGTGGNGGDAGGSIRICVGANTGTNDFQLTSSPGQLTAVGGVGGNGSGLTNVPAGGGGSGGYIGIYCLGQLALSATSNTLSVNGGAGGTGVGTGPGGGGGGGGYWIMIAPTFNLTGLPTATGGAAGTPAGTPAAAAGSAGLVLQSTGTPSLPLIALMEDKRALDAMKTVAYLQGKEVEGHGVVIKNEVKETAQWVSAFYCKKGQFDDLCYQVLEGQDVNGKTAMVREAVGDAPVKNVLPLRANQSETESELADAA